MTIKHITSFMFEAKKEQRTENYYPWKLFYIEEIT